MWYIKIVIAATYLFTAKFLEKFLLACNECKFNKPARECSIMMRNSGFLLVISMIFKKRVGAGN